MIYKLIALSVVFGLVVANPAPTLENLLPTYIDNETSEYEVALKPDLITLFFNVITKVIGYKVSAVSIAVNVIDWVIRNSIGVVLGSIAAIFFCKLTGKCNTILDTVVPIKELITTEHLESAEKLFHDAVLKYAQERVGTIW